MDKTTVYNEYVFPILEMLVIILIGYIFSVIVHKFITRISEKTKFDESLEKFLANLAKTVILVLTVIIALVVAGVPSTGLIAGVSAVLAALALALQGLLSNVAGGIFILVTRPFKTGDFVDLGGSSGTVKEIKIIHTILFTPDNKEIIMPNGVVVNSTVVNYSNSKTRRVDLVFSIGYDDDARLAEKVILDTALSHEFTLTDPAPFVRESAHSASSIDITARIWCDADNYWTVYFDMIEKVRAELGKNGISIPYNQLDVHVTNN